MDDDNKKPIEKRDEEEPSLDNVLQLINSDVGETETDVCEPELEPKGLSIEPTRTNRQSLLQRKKLDEVKALVNELIEGILPVYELDDRATKEVEDSQTVAEKGQQLLSESPTSRYDDERINRILGLLDRYTRNLEIIEERMLTTAQESRFINEGRPTTVELDSSMELQLTQCTDNGTQTNIRMDLISTSSPKSIQRALQSQFQHSELQQVDVVPPCERRQHTIFISTNGATGHPAPGQRRTLLERVGQTLGDFASAFCLCLQVNKDCVFCLGFFVAFVISASFLTAFFYRTISLTTLPGRVPVEATGSSTPPVGMVTIRFNGGYYYIYNSQRQHIV